MPIMAYVAGRFAAGFLFIYNQIRRNCPMTESPRLTPMFEQYLRIKEEYPDALLFYRMGDFYELFFEDAVLVARELQIALTSRNRDAEAPIPMCGVPWHAVTGYLTQLVEKGYKIAICDQVQDPRAAKGLVERAVTRVLTPGTVVEDANLVAGGHNYLGAVAFDQEKGWGGFAFVDVSTGEWSGLFSRKTADIWSWVLKMSPRELLINDETAVPNTLGLNAAQIVRLPHRSHFDYKKSARSVLEAQGVKDLSALGLEDKKPLVEACGAILAYLSQTQKKDPTHLRPFTPLDLGRHLIIDELTERNLEIFVRQNGRKGPGTLRHVMDQTVTPAGGRLFEERMRHPFREAPQILETQECVEFFLNHDQLRENLREKLKPVYDLERISTRITLNRASPVDFTVLKQSLAALPGALAALTASPDPNRYPTDDDKRGSNLPSALVKIVQQWDNMEDYANLLESALVDSPPNVISEGGLFKTGYRERLDELIDLVEHGQEKVQQLFEREKSTHNLPKLKLGYNRVFGYFFEIGRASAGAVLPQHFVRRQTLANAERYTSEELKQLEENIISASEERKTMEYNLFQELREIMSKARPRLIFMADLIAHMDYWQALAVSARRWNWIKPELDDTAGLDIKEGRHPVVEALNQGAPFVPNSLYMDEQKRLCIITGPNMAGKSTILRQIAIIAIMAQMGSFVPAGYARIGLVDRIFSRVGASDNLAEGQSTFMVEMMETARILRQSTRRSLVILDEIGRGTSTFDGLAIAFAVVEELAKRGRNSIRTIFATHFHELTSLEGNLPGIFTMNIAIKEWGGEIIFLHRLVPGPSDRSYGVEVARLAGVPQNVVQRAKEILGNLEKSRPLAGGRENAWQMMTLPGLKLPVRQPKEAAPVQEEKHPVVEALKKLDPDALTPLEALRRITDWKKMLK